MSLAGARGLAAALALLAGASACRKKATAQECEAIVDHFAELVVREQFPDAGPELIAQERAREQREAKADDAFKNCPSQVTPAEHACATRATTSEGVLKCLE